MSIGELSNWKMDAHLAAARELVRSDDVLLALDLLTSHLPGFYRANPPEEVKNLKNEIMARIVGPDFYAREEEKCDFGGVEDAIGTLRAKLVLEECQKLNRQHKIPCVYDIGPGNFWLPLLLFSEGIGFCYKPITLTSKSRNSFFDTYPYLRGEPDHDDPKVFLCMELIEHLQNPDEIRSAMLRECDGLADIIHLSTPFCSYDGREREMSSALGHLRTYNSSEFVAAAMKLFPEYTLEYFPSQVQHIRMVKK